MIPKLELVIEPDKVICKNLECEEKGKYLHCYLHTYMLQDCWINYWSTLNDEQRELIMDPNQFRLY